MFWEDTRQPVEIGSECRATHTYTLSLPPSHHCLDGEVYHGYVLIMLCHNFLIRTYYVRTYSTMVLEYHLVTYYHVPMVFEIMLYLYTCTKWYHGSIPYMVPWYQLYSSTYTCTMVHIRTRIHVYVRTYVRTYTCTTYVRTCTYVL